VLRTVIVLSLLLGGCAGARLRATQQAENNAVTGLMRCDAQKWPTKVARANCENDALLGAYRSVKYPNMDLVEWLASQNALIAQEEDAGTMTEQQGSVLITQNVQHVRDQEAQRGNLSAAQQAMAAHALMNASQAWQKAAAPPQTHCYTSFIGTQAYTNCY
jgi:hypothetical protein